MEMTGMETKQNDVQKERLEQQIRFIIEVDKVKNIFRQTYLADGQRKPKRAYEGRRGSGKSDGHGVDP